MIYTYFVSYTFTTRDSKYGVGRTAVISQEPISSMEQIVKTENELNGKDGGKVVHIITGYQLLRMDSESPEPAPPVWPVYGPQDDGVPA